MAWGAATLRWGMAPRRPGKPPREESGRDGFGAALIRLQGSPGSMLGAAQASRNPLLPCQQHLQNAAWIGPLGAACRADPAQPQERGPLRRGLLSLTKVPSKREEAPSLYWCERGSQSDPALRMRGSLGKGGSLRFPQGPQMPAGQAGIWCLGHGMVQSLGVLGSPPWLREAKGAGEG